MLDDGDDDDDDLFSPVVFFRATFVFSYLSHQWAFSSYPGQNENLSDVVRSKWGNDYKVLSSAVGTQNMVVIIISCFCKMEKIN